MSPLPNLYTLAGTDDTRYFSPNEVSRAHAKVVKRAGRLYAVDLSSTNGTFVNETRVPPRIEGVALEHGDILSLGPSRVSTYMFFEVTQQ
jgi:pSer/pThr/pTyr-binding forkhead associated (FHA) protein